MRNAGTQNTCTPSRPIGVRVGLILFVLVLMFRQVATILVPLFHQVATMPLDDVTAYFLYVATSVFLVAIAGVALAYQRRLATARHTFYAITTDRIIIVTDKHNRSVDSYTDLTSDHITLVERADGSGNLIFGETPGRSPEGKPAQKTSGFYAIPDVRQVERYLKEFCSQRA